MLHEMPSQASKIRHTERGRGGGGEGDRERLIQKCDLETLGQDKVAPRVGLVSFPLFP